MFAPEFFQQGVDLHTDLGIEVGGGFIQENKLRIVDQSEGQSQPLFLTARERTVKGIVLFLQLQTLQQSS
jgi:hypothetical protein